MRNIEVNYRVKLGIGFIFNEPLAALLAGKLNANDIDIQIIKSDTVIEDFSNTNLDVANAFEGHTSVMLNSNVSDKNLKKYFLEGNINTSYESLIVHTIKVGDYVLYESHDNTFYCTRCDLKEFSEVFYLEIDKVWQVFIYYYSLAYNVSLNTQIVSISLSEDGRVCKLKTKGFYRVDPQVFDKMQLNRILPS